MAELRWNPMIRDWVMIASNRQTRPDHPKGWCPFCTTKENTKIPQYYDVLQYDNDYPALSQNPPEMDIAMSDTAGDIYKTAPAYGKCEVVLFSSDHEMTLPKLDDEHFLKVVRLWAERFKVLSFDKNMKYIFIFENRGNAVGVTMQHPHGQIYAYSVLPKKIEVELESCKEFYDEHCRCLFCRMNEEESKFKERVITENKDFIAFIPFFSDYAYGVYIVSKSHKATIADFNETEYYNLMKILKKITGAYDSLFDITFPYMMCMHNAPVNNELVKFNNLDKFYHFHIEIYPPLRSATQQQYQASSETGVWAHCNPTSPEIKAQEIRDALSKYEKNSGGNIL